PEPGITFRFGKRGWPPGGHPLFQFFGDLGNGLTRLPWKQETPGSSPGSPTSSLTTCVSYERAWYIGCALGLQPREEISIISVRSNSSAGVAHWLSAGSPVQPTEFDSPHSLQPE